MSNFQLHGDKINNIILMDMMMLIMPFNTEGSKQ